MAVPFRFTFLASLLDLVYTSHFGYGRVRFKFQSSTEVTTTSFPHSLVVDGRLTWCCERLVQVFLLRFDGELEVNSELRSVSVMNGADWKKSDLHIVIVLLRETHRIILLSSFRHHRWSCLLSVLYWPTQQSANIFPESCDFHTCQSMFFKFVWHVHGNLAWMQDLCLFFRRSEAGTNPWKLTHLEAILSFVCMIPWYLVRDLWDS